MGHTLGRMGCPGLGPTLVLQQACCTGPPCTHGLHYEALKGEAIPLPMQLGLQCHRSVADLSQVMSSSFLPHPTHLKLVFGLSQRLIHQPLLPYDLPLPLESFGLGAVGLLAWVLSWWSTRSRWCTPPPQPPPAHKRPLILGTSAYVRHQIKHSRANITLLATLGH